MKIFKCFFYPKKSAIEEFGARSLAIAIEAPNQKLATAKATLKFAEDFPDADSHYFNPKVFLDDDEILNLELNVWNDEILDNFEWDDKAKTLTAKAPVTISAPPSLTASDSDNNETVQSHTLPLNTELAHFWLGGLFTATPDERRAANLAVMDTDNSYLQNVILAVNSVKACKHCYNHIRHNLLDNIKKIWPVDGKTPELSMVAAFVNEWMEALNDESASEDRERRAAVTERWIAKHHKARTPSGALAGGGNITDRGKDFKHNFDTLALEIGLGIVSRAMDFDIYNPPIGIVNRARDIVKKKEKQFSDWFDIFRSMPLVLNFSRAMVIYTIKYAPDNVNQKPGDLLSYIRRTMTETNHAQPDPQIVAAACGIQSTEQEKNETTPAPQNTGSTVDTQPKQTATVATYTAQSQPAPKKLEDESPVASVDSRKPSTEKVASNEVEKTEVVPQAAPDPDAFVLRADELEKELGDSENLSLWKSVMRTNPRYTKEMGDLGFGGTSINAEYMVMRATESFGPAGTGWGWTIMEDKMVEGAPLSEKIFEGTKFVGKRTLRDADGSLLFELNHYLRIALWYIKDGEKRTVENFGSTPYRQTTKNGIYCDSEVHKKSLTDAIKKCLSMLGFSADIWLGLYDDAAYKAESVLEFGLKDATDKANDSNRIREELDERFKQNVETMRRAVSQNEVSKIASSLTRTVGIHLKSAKEINNQEYVKYLEGRLRRLEEVKSECLAKLQEKAA